MKTTNNYPRALRHCRCPKHAEWGYQLWRWIGGKKSWSGVCWHLDLGEISKHAAKHRHVLIKCRACGEEILRQQPQPAPTDE